MADTKIEWADRVWNPVHGCTKVSAGCRVCYAERMAKRLRGRHGYPADDPFRLTVRPDRLDQPRGWQKPRRIFVCSMGDIFHEDVPRAFLKAVMGVTMDCPQHVFMLLTKRPERMKEFTNELGGWPPNVQLGVSVENQATADERIPLLLDTTAATRFLSCEPLLGPIDLSAHLRRVLHMGADVQGMLRNRSFDGLQHTDGRSMTRREAEDKLYELHGNGVKVIPVGDACACFSPDEGCPGHRIDGIIAGGESGPGANPCHPDWARDLRDQAARAGRAFMWKQWGEWIPFEPEARPPFWRSQHNVAIDGHLLPDFDAADCPAYWRNDFPPVVHRRVGKVTAGRLLDGRIHDDLPPVRS